MSQLADAEVTINWAWPYYYYYGVIVIIIIKKAKQHGRLGLITVQEGPAHILYPRHVLDAEHGHVRVMP